MLKFRKFNYATYKRLVSTSNNVIEHLKDRTLIRVSGPEVSNFLQGLITNDIAHLGSKQSSMYAMFLNNRGRILYDTIIYRNNEKDTYLLECDKQVADPLQKHLKLYRVRRKIDIVNLIDEYKIYVLYNKQQNASTASQQQKYQDLAIFRDPRLPNLGTRIIAKADADVKTQIGEPDREPPNENYRWLRYSLGVGEGVDDLPPGESFPLECNCDYLHGISFHKGCYVGQELTARVHHTGVVRKRLMPIHFVKTPSKIPEEKIVHEGVNLGKFRGIESDAGLGLLRIDKALKFNEIKFGDGVGTTFVPKWWPAEAPKEKINMPKLQ